MSDKKLVPFVDSIGRTLVGEVVGDTKTTGDVRIIGDLTVTGGSSDIKVTDKSITVNYGGTAESSFGAGIDVEESNVVFAAATVLQ